MGSKIIVLLVGALLVSGCCTTPDPTIITRIDTVEIYKPVFDVPEDLKSFPVLARPELPLDQLSAGDESNPGYVAKTIIQSVLILQEYAEALEDQVSAYRKVVSEADKAQQKLSTDNTTNLIKE